MTNKKTTTTTAAASRQALADAKAKAADWATAHEAAVEAAEDLIARLTSGDESVTDAELGAAEAAAKRAGLLAQAGPDLVARAQRALVNEDTKLADLFADVIGEAFRWLVPVSVVTQRRDVAPNAGGAPVAFLLQEKPGTDNGGVLGGVLRVTFYRPALFAPLNADRLQQAAEKRGYLAQVIPGSSAQRGDQFEDLATIRVHAAAPEVPVLAAAPGTEAVRHFAQGLPSRLSKAVWTAPVGIFVQGEAPAPNARAELVSHRILSTEQVEDGQRMTVQATCRVTPSPTLKANPHPLLRDAVTDLGGVVEPGLGRVVAVDEVTVESPDRENAEYRRPWTVTARLVVAFAVAE